MENANERIKVQIPGKTIAQLFVALHYEDKKEPLAWIKDVFGRLHLQRDNLHIIIEIEKPEGQYGADSILKHVVIKTDKIEAEYNGKDFYKQFGRNSYSDFLEDFLYSLSRVKSEDNEIAVMFLPCLVKLSQAMISLITYGKQVFFDSRVHKINFVAIYKTNDLPNLKIGG